MKTYAGFTLLELSKVHKDNELVRGLVTEVITLGKRVYDLENILSRHSICDVCGELESLRPGVPRCPCETEE
jgi:hypothetical protein